ncbi:MAG: type I methionyl aminopeptidase [Gemmatimonadetes bacterium]|nr:type I methionyl aminopeptidase [Gemmatimonadota bacterium]NIR79700.1 type I methionyl aminopeptidase [Gemmatimonadota bacterium]NIT88408.1 type I methionyl aminopeptidase [Gemmatimonadota bacterium]NIU32221.1 type I methionyl aminopeptidase [Gemmatimonadota bacterium]NIU36766.1 type I methionyl aminopeptidase [Gemmatimonadota bacterium]
MIHLKSASEIETIARGGRVIDALLTELAETIEPGMSTAEVDAFCDTFIRSHDGAEPAFKGLYGFPGSVCTSMNEEVVHGIPSEDRKLGEGDILSVDVGVKLDGWCSDSAWTFPVGEVDAHTAELLRITEEALERAVDAARLGAHVGDIGAAVMEVVAGTDFAIIRDLVGHGVGREVHEQPQVPNYGRKGHGALLREGLVIAIEPMLSAGSPEIRTLDDRWTVVSADGARTAHFEHTVAVTSDGPRILTGAPDTVESAA